MESYFYDLIIAWDAVLSDLNIKHHGLTGI